MMNRIASILGAVALLISVSSCIEHEVIPPPVNTVDLNCSFSGYVQGTQVEFTQNVNGYKGYTGLDEYIAPSPLPSRRVYMSEITSPSDMRAIRVKFGSLNWDAAANTEPTLTMFNDFHTASAVNNQIFSNQGLSGLEVTYTDMNSAIWSSKQNNPMPQTLAFSNIKQQSDNTGDYSMFDCTFSCYVYRTNPLTSTVDSLYVQNGKYSGWFKK